jgi:hypothetical protein
VGTTVSHNGHDWTPAKGARFAYFWEYVVTLPPDKNLVVDRIPVGKATIRRTVQSNAVLVYSFDRNDIALALTRLADMIEE